MDIRIYTLGDHPTVRFAAEELGWYLSRITGAGVTTDQQVEYAPGDAGIWVGVAEAFPGLALPAVADVWLDDAISVQVDADKGIIAGNNPRSVLLGVYRYLRTLGCRWVRPGADGECLPEVDFENSSIHLVETPSYRHRALDLAGALSRECILDIIDWCPKVGLTGIFLESDSCLGVCNLWYSHRMNPTKTPEPISEEQAAAWREEFVAAIRKRDMLYHAKGHGWTHEALGLTGSEFKNPLPPKVQPLVMLKDGERKSIGAGVTNLCYSNPEARRRYVETVVQYADEHPEVDFLHVWLADGINNHCECENCVPHRPADLYLVLLNELDAVLAARGLDTRIVYLFYSDLLWPPERETIAHPDRFSLMYAPFFRSFNVSFDDFDLDELPELPPYTRNRQHYSRDTKENADFLPHWIKVPHADSFDFDYQYWLSQYDDPSGLHRAAVEHGDIQSLRLLGLNGLVGCYSMRSFYPTGLGMAAMAETLWNRETSFDDLIEDYFSSAFGIGWNVAFTYLEGISALCDPAYFRGEMPVIDEEMAETLEEVPEFIDESLPLLQMYAEQDEPCWAASWRCLVRHAEITRPLAAANAARARGDGEESARLFEETHQLALKYEDELFPMLDTWLFSVYLDERTHPEKGEVP